MSTAAWLEHFARLTAAPTDVILALEGLWQNEYGSQLSIVATGAMLTGAYSSTTGSTGVYRVVGYQGSCRIDGGLPIGLAIAWHAIDGSPRDASWAWTSSLSGQYLASDGDERLVLNHLLVAATLFPGLCEAGTYLDKLIYRRIGETDDVRTRAEDSVDTATTELSCWGSDAGAVLELKMGGGKAPATLRGTLQLGDQLLDVAGFAGNVGGSGEDGPTALAAALIDPLKDSVVTLCGTISAEQSSCALQFMASRATTPDATYLQTTLTSIRFDRTQTAPWPQRRDGTVA